MKGQRPLLKAWMFEVKMGKTTLSLAVRSCRCHCGRQVTRRKPLNPSAGMSMSITRRLQRARTTC